MSPTATKAKSKKASARKGPTTVARAYLKAIDARDLDAATALWKPGSIDRLVGMADLRAPDEIKAYFENLFAAIPDFKLTILSITAQKESAAVRWSMTGTFDGTTRIEGFAANGASIELEGIDLLTIREGEIVDNVAYTNGVELARQIGAMPPQGSRAEKAMCAAFNAKTNAGGLLGKLRERRAG